jgi:2-oxoisovalerate dehydrogenase E1 component
VGRGLAFPIADSILRGDKSSSVKQVSFVTIGDGSVHNAHFLSAFNLARHARFRRNKCPVVFGVSDNGLSISYPTDGYANFLFSKTTSNPNSKSRLDRDGIPVFKANGCDMFDVYDKTLQATQYSRKNSAPSLVLYQELVRRFGHAATDRQHAYLDADTVDRMADSDVVASGIVHAVEQWNALTYSEVYDRFIEIGDMVRRAFNTAAEEPKITTRKEMIDQVAQPMVQVPRLRPELLTTQPGETEIDKSKRTKRDVMRKHMTRVISETMTNNPKVVYIGEDVEHGGYYLVTDGLASKFPGRVIDFPPDETTLLGAAMGFSHAGLLPIIEIPYSKYLDCGADM